jgi:hypothetical protein
LFALASRFYQRAVHVNRGQVEESVGLPFPDALPNVVEDALQDIDVDTGETTAVIAGRGGIGNPSSAQGIEKHFVVATEFYVLKTRSLTQGVVGDIENVIGIVKREMDLEQMQMVVDGINKADLPGHGMNGADTAMDCSTRSVSDLIMNVVGSKHWLIATDVIVLVQALLNTALAGGQSLGYIRVHSKSLRASGLGKTQHLSKHRKSREISSFFAKSPRKPNRVRLVKA